MKCSKCGSSEFQIVESLFNKNIKNNHLAIKLEVPSCKECQTLLLDETHENKLYCTAADQYRIENDLLTSQQIIDLRKKMHMSQKKFAEYLNVGEASIKRWETHYIQDESQDELIRLKCDPSYAKLHLLQLQKNEAVPDIYNGMKPFSFSHFKNTVLFFINNFKEKNIQLTSVLQFYADFFYYKIKKKSITGTSYRALKNGPFPDFGGFFSLIETGYVKQTSQDTFCALKNANLEVFTKEEKEALEYVCHCHKKQCLIKLSQLEKGFLSCDERGRMSYANAEYLLI